MVASTNLSSKGQTSATFTIDGLGSLWDTDSYQQAYVTCGGFTSSPNYPPPPPGSGYSAGSFSISGLTGNTTYTAYGYAVAADGNTYPAGSVTFTTDPPPPGSVSGMGGSGGDGYASVYWSAASGATSYDVTWSGPTSGSTSTTGTSITITGLTNGSQYTITITPRNISGTGGSGTVYITPNPPAPSGTPTVSLTANINRYISVSWNSIANATHYKVYANSGSGDFLKADVSSLSTTIQVDLQWTLYTIRVVPWNDTVEGVGGTNTVRSSDDTAPTGTGASVTNTSSNSITIGNFTGTDSMSGVQKWRVEKLSGSGGTSVESTEVTTSTSTVTFFSLSASTTYYFRISCIDNWSNLSYVEISATTLDPIPSTPYTSSFGEGSMTISWGSVTNATNYELHVKSSSDGWGGASEVSFQTSSTSQVFYGSYGSSYDFRVKAYVGGVWYGYSGVGTDTIRPQTPSISKGSVNNTSITVNTGGLSGNYDEIQVERYSSGSSYIDTKFTTANSSVTWTGLTSGTTYIFKARSKYGSAYSINYSNSLTIQVSPRPNNFDWDVDKVSGQDVNVTASEWNAFTTRINDFRVYTGYSSFIFSTAHVDDDITASVFNEAVSNIGELSPPVSPPSLVTSNVTEIEAAHFNTLRDSLNSIP